MNTPVIPSFRYQIFFLIMLMALLNYIDRGAIAYASASILPEYGFDKADWGNVLGYSVWTGKRSSLIFESWVSFCSPFAFVLLLFCCCFAVAKPRGKTKGQNQGAKARGKRKPNIHRTVSLHTALAFVLLLQNQGAKAKIRYVFP